MSGGLEYADGKRVRRGYLAGRYLGSPIAALRHEVGDRFGRQDHLDDAGFMSLFERGVAVEEARKRTSVRLREHWRKMDHLERLRREWS